ncbi:MAG: putative membrane protein, partial [Planctomycetota bacterium]
MKIIFSIIGTYLGAVATHDWHGILFGLPIGYLLGAHIELKGNLTALQQQVKLLKTNLIDSQVDVRAASMDSETISEAPTVLKSQASMDEEIDSEAPTVIGSVNQHQDDAEAPGLIPAQQNTQSDDDEEIELDIDIPQTQDLYVETPPSPVDKAIEFVRHFFTTGNVVVKMGIIILFFGVGFLIRYAVERQVLPIELRLIGIGIGAIVMLILGWRLRHNRTGYALVLQGGAVGIMYITIFATAKTFHLINPAVALVMMIFLVTFSAVLAYVQDSRSLAIFGSAGGFIAPILTSTGSGSHVMLFSYYALLNAGIFGMAWVKAWRSLNWVGFVFTFVIGAAWGIKYYQPQFFNSTEPFLILFFLFYLGIAVLFAHRQPPQLKGLVDGTLVFGVPLVAFTLQAALVGDFEFGRALSALGMAAIYIGLAKILWHKQVEGMRLLTESCVGLRVLLAPRAKPKALDG